MSGFERKLLPNGQENPKYIDLCDEDQPIAGQKFACLSFKSSSSAGITLFSLHPPNLK